MNYIKSLFSTVPTEEEVEEQTQQQRRDERLLNERREMGDRYVEAFQLLATDKLQNDRNFLKFYLMAPQYELQKKCEGLSPFFIVPPPRPFVFLVTREKFPLHVNRIRGTVTNYDVIEQLDGSFTTDKIDFNPEDYFQLPEINLQSHFPFLMHIYDTYFKNDENDGSYILK